MDKKCGRTRRERCCREEDGGRGRGRQRLGTRMRMEQKKKMKREIYATKKKGPKQREEIKISF